MTVNTLMPIMSFMTIYYHRLKNLHRSDSVTQNFYKIFRLTILALIIIIVSSCEEGTTGIGTGILPDGDFIAINSTDTIGALSYTIYDAAVRTENAAVSYMGHIYDPYFGTTTAEFVTQIRMGGEWDDKPFTVDSVKLLLTILDVKGVVSGVPHSIKISEIAQQIYTDSAYYSDQVVPLTGFEINDIVLPELKPDTVNLISINIPKEFGEYITRDTSKLFYSNTKPDFRSYFKGLYFSMNPGPDPLLLSLSLAQPTSIGAYNNVMVLYMHNEAGTPTQFWFILDPMNRNASFNKFSHDFSTASPEKKIVHINDGFLDTLSYLQYLNGVYTRIAIPGLESLKSDPDFSNIAVNKARLYLPVYFDGSQFKPSTVPPQLYLRYRTKNGSKYVVPDYNIDQYHDFFDGKIDSTNSVYKFNLATFVQGYFDDATDEILPEVELFQVSSTRNVIFKANSSKTPVKFEFTYTKF